ncbi:MAG: hypothetical protein IAE91_03935 [Ignavibacteriaceae bacterium]|nr:hypothetical protein [Ignavibacteriaceae bacterium]
MYKNLPSAVAIRNELSISSEKIVEYNSDDQLNKLSEGFVLEENAFNDLGLLISHIQYDRVTGDTLRYLNAEYDPEGKIITLRDEINRNIFLYTYTYSGSILKEIENLKISLNGEFILPPSQVIYDSDGNLQRIEYSGEVIGENKTLVFYENNRPVKVHFWYGDIVEVFYTETGQLSEINYIYDREVEAIEVFDYSDGRVVKSDYISKEIELEIFYFYDVTGLVTRKLKTSTVYDTYMPGPLLIEHYYDTN